MLVRTTWSGESGDDRLYGESGPDQLSGGWGNDLLDGGSNRILLEGNEGSDHIYRRAVETTSSSARRMESRPDDGNDFMDGGDDNDTIRDDRGDDTAIGEILEMTSSSRASATTSPLGDLDPRGGGVPPGSATTGLDVLYGDRDALPEVDDGLGLGQRPCRLHGGGRQPRHHVRRCWTGPMIGGGSPFFGTTFGGIDLGDQILRRSW